MGLVSTVVELPGLGPVTLEAGPQGLRRMELGAGAAAAPSEPDRQAEQHLAAAVRELTEYSQGRRREFAVPLDLQGTAFQQSVWQALLAVPYGETRTYGEIAAQVGRPTAARAVGAAVGANPVCVIVPCHRILGAGGSLTGFAYGLARKKQLLELESAGS